MASENLIRQKIVSAVIEQLKLISSDNGFYSQAGDHVYEWISPNITQDSYQSLVLKDTKDILNDTQILNHTLSLDIDILSKDSSNAIWNLREASSDVIKSMGEFSQKLNYPCKYISSIYRTYMAENTSEYLAEATLSFEISYETPRWEQ